MRESQQKTVSKSLYWMNARAEAKAAEKVYGLSVCVVATLPLPSNPMPTLILRLNLYIYDSCFKKVHYIELPYYFNI